VAYCLGITDVDPIELDLYFERFISTARKKPPDFDIDFSWKDRDEVYRYVFDKYNGPSAPLGTTMQAVSTRRRSPRTPPSNGAVPSASWAKQLAYRRKRSMR
jgi:DNA polymerase III alpha subunit